MYGRLDRDDYSAILPRGPRNILMIIATMLPLNIKEQSASPSSAGIQVILCAARTALDLQVSSILALFVRSSVSRGAARRLLAASIVYLSLFVRAETRAIAGTRFRDRKSTHMLQCVETNRSRGAEPIRADEDAIAAIRAARS